MYSQDIKRVLANNPSFKIDSTMLSGKVNDVVTAKVSDILPSTLGNSNIWIPSASANNNVTPTYDGNGTLRFTLKNAGTDTIAVNLSSTSDHSKVDATQTISFTISAS